MGLERGYNGVRRVVERHEKSSLAAAWQGAFRLPLFLPENGRFLGLGLQVGLQTGVTFFEKWGYTFAFLGYK